MRRLVASLSEAEWRAAWCDIVGVGEACSRALAALREWLTAERPTPAMHENLLLPFVVKGMIVASDSAPGRGATTPV